MRQARRRHVFLLRSSRMPEIARWEARGSGQRSRLKIHPDCLQLSMRDRPLWLSLLKRCFLYCCSIHYTSVYQALTTALKLQPDDSKFVYMCRRANNLVNVAHVPVTPAQKD